MLHCASLLILMTLSVDVEVRTVDGQTAQGALVALDQQLTLQADGGGTTTLATDSVLTIQRLSPLPAAGTLQETWVTLVCGTRLVGTQLRSQESALRISACDCEHEIPLKQVRAVRFNRPSALDEQWSEILQSDFVGDVLVIRRAHDALDYLEGVIRGFSDDQVQFEYEGEVLEVPRQKLEGIIFFRKGTTPRPRIQLATVDNGSFQLERVSVDGELLSGKTTSGVELTLPLNQLRRLDFRGGKMVYLGDVTPHRVDIGTSGPATVQARALERLLYEPSANQGLFGERLALRLPGNEGIRYYSKGLALHSRTEVTYRLEEEYTRLKATVGMDPRSAARGLVKLVIFNGTQQLFAQEVSAADDPLELDLDVSGTKRLRILVDYADNWDLSDHLNLCDLRLTK